MSEFSHFNMEGRSRMVDVGDKDITRRTAVAKGLVRLNPATFSMLRDGKMKKGDVLAVAQIGGIMAAKRAPELIPMCHPIMLTGIDISFELDEVDSEIHIMAKVSCNGNTGVEMEALTAVSAAALTIYDMCKSAQRDIVIADIRLISKTGGKSGDYRRDD